MIFVKNVLEASPCLAGAFLFQNVCCLIFVRGSRRRLPVSCTQSAAVVRWRAFGTKTVLLVNEEDFFFSNGQ